MNPLRHEPLRGHEDHDMDAEHGGERPFLELTGASSIGGGGGGGNGSNGSTGVKRLLHRGPNNRFKVMATTQGRSLLKVFKKQ
jgi:hypothetical protein